MFAVSLKTFEYAQHLLGWLAISPVRHQFGITQDGIERRAQFMAHVGEKLRFVLTRLFQLPALVLNFVEETYILNRDSGLVGECRDEFDLLVGERLYFRARQDQNTDRHALTQHGNAEDRAVISQSLCFDRGVFGVSLYVGNMNDATLS